MRKSLSKQEIVKSKIEIDNVFKSGKSFGCQGLKVIVAPNGLEYSRIIVIPVKHFGNSVQRNHIRRQYKELFRNNKSQIKTGFDFAFVVYKGKATSYEEKKNNLISLINQAFNA